MSARATRANAAADALLTILPPRLAARLAAHCANSGDQFADIVADAVLFFLDEADEQAERARLAAEREREQRFVDGLLDCIASVSR